MNNLTVVRGVVTALQAVDGYEDFALSEPERRAVSAGSVAAAVAGGNLAIEIRSDGRDETAQLLNTLGSMQQELVAVISKYVHVNADDIKVSMEKKGNYEVLEVNIVMPN